MAISVTASTTAVTTALVRPVASISVVYAQVGIVYTVPVSAVDYIALTVSEYLDVTGQFKFIADAQVVVDTTEVALDKGLRDALSELGSHASLQLAKPAADSVALVDALVAVLVKYAVDTYNVSDAVARGVAKAAFDAFPLGDDSTFALNKLINDGVAMNDSFDATDGSIYTIAKYFMNMAFASDELRREVDKRLVDAVLATEAKALFFTKAPILDTAPVSDYSLRIVDLAKADTVAPGDAVALDITKLLSDAVTYAEFVVSVLAKALSDSVTATDARTFDLTKPLADTLSAPDAYAAVTSKLLADSVGFVDTVFTTLIFIRSFADSVSTADAQVFEVAKLLADEAFLADTATRTVAKLISDGFALNDMADVGDGITFTLSHSVANVAFIADNAARQVQLGKAELVSATDSGLLRNQGYCDLTYFAEDYVGDSRSF